MVLRESEIKKIISEIIKKNIISERDLLRIPNRGSEQDEMTEPENMEEMPPEEMGGEQEMGGEEMPMEEPQQEFASPHIGELVELLNANPDRAEGVLKYAKGIIGDDNVPTNNSNMEMEEPPVGPEEMGESRTFDLDEMISDIITGGNKKSKPTITRPIGKSYNIKSKMFRPVVGN